MQSRAIRAALFPAVLAIGVIAAACAPIGGGPAPAPVHTLCAGSAAPGPGDQAAVVAQGGANPTVVKFKAANPTEFQYKVAQLKQSGTVLAAGPDQPVHATATTINPPGNNPDYTNKQIDFQSNEVDFPAAWNAASPLDGTGVRVAVVDTGVQADHFDLSGNVVAGNDLVFGNTSSNFARVDGYGHGTHVAGTIAAVDNVFGVIGGAPHSTIVPVRVLDCQGNGSTSTVAAGVLWASDPAGGAAKVINMSLGGSGEDPALQVAIQTAINRGVTVVSAAGNCGLCSPVPNEVEYPGAYAGTNCVTPSNVAPCFSSLHGQGVIAVGALDGTTPGFPKANFSNNNDYVTVAAPGVNIYSTVPLNAVIKDPSGLHLLSGTSMATPHVAAVAALIYQRCPSDSPAQVETRILSGVQTLANPAQFVSGTVGMLRADAAVSGASCP